MNHCRPNPVQVVPTAPCGTPRAHNGGRPGPPQSGPVTGGAKRRTGQWIQVPTRMVAVLVTF